MQHTTHSEAASGGITAIEISIREAGRYCDNYYRKDGDDSDLESFEYYVERSYIELLVLSDRLGLKATYQMTTEHFLKAKEEGFGKTESYEDESYPKWTGQVRMIADAIAASYGLAKTRRAQKPSATP